MNHVIAIDCENSDFKYVQILGGTGCCIPTLLVHKSWDTVQDEV